MRQQRMSGEIERIDAMDRRVTDALERVPSVDLPANFAARVANQVPARRGVAVTKFRYGLMAVRICMAVLLIAIVVVAMRASGRAIVNITLEGILCGELVGLSMWMSGMWRLGGPEV